MHFASKIEHFVKYSLRGYYCLRRRSFCTVSNPEGRDASYHKRSAGRVDVEDCIVAMHKGHLWLCSFLYERRAFFGFSRCFIFVVTILSYRWMDLSVSTNCNEKSRFSIKICLFLSAVATDDSNGSCCGHELQGGCIASMGHWAVHSAIGVPSRVPSGYDIAVFFFHSFLCD